MILFDLVLMNVRACVRVCVCDRERERGGGSGEAGASDRL